MEQRLIEIIDKLLELNYGDVLPIIEEYIEIKKELANKANTVVEAPVKKEIDFLKPSVQTSDKPPF